jgi:membrane protein required for colicin V production
MTPADWLILFVILLNVILAAMHGFFAEALSMAGLVVGYIVAAWQYPRLADWLVSFLKSDWLTFSVFSSFF